MILAPLSEFGTYLNLHPLLSRVEQALITLDFSKPGEKIYVDGEKLIAIPSFDKGKSRGNALLEAHNRYIDVQVCLQGNETMGWRSRTDCHQPQAEFDGAKDIILFNDQPMSYVAVPPYHFVIFFPNDCHAPLIGEGYIRKVVFKLEI